MQPHAFIAMPFGRKLAADSKTWIDFNAIWLNLLTPALVQAGCQPMRADQELSAGDIRADMFQELLSADLVLVDLTVANPNVWYELGVRHALRKRGVVLVYGQLPGDAAAKPFDVYTDRKRAYPLSETGTLPEGQALQAEIDALAKMVRATLDSSTRRVVSPVYQLLPHLEQPLWKHLLMGADNEFSDAYRAWSDRVKVARRSQRPGDILTLAQDTPARALAQEALREAGISLLSLRQAGLALEQLDQALAIDPRDVVSRQKRAIVLCRQGQFDEARALLEALVEEVPGDAETLVLLGRVDKEKWLRRWRPSTSANTDTATTTTTTTTAEPPDGSNPPPAPPTAEQIRRYRELAGAQEALLSAATATYQRGFMLDPRHYYAGVNALMLSLLRADLGGQTPPEELALLSGGVRWAVRSALAADPKNYWALETQAELSLLLGDLPEVQHHWATALAASDQAWYSLDASRQMLVMLRDLGFRPELTQVALALVDAEIQQLDEPFKPRQVLLFSGHVMDKPGSTSPRFTPDMQEAATQRLEQVLEKLGANGQDLALCQAAAGGDLLFLQACVARGVRCQVMLPLEEPAFVQSSVLPSLDGERWRELWLSLRNHPLLAPTVFMPERLGPLPKEMNPFERCNRWLLNTALAHDPQKLRFICLWDGQFPADGSPPDGGTHHMVSLARERTVHEHWIDTRRLHATTPTVPLAGPAPSAPSAPAA